MGAWPQLGPVPLPGQNLIDAPATGFWLQSLALGRLLETPHLGPVPLPGQNLIDAPATGFWLQA